MPPRWKWMKIDARVTPHSATRELARIKRAYMGSRLMIHHMLRGVDELTRPGRHIGAMYIGETPNCVTNAMAAFLCT